MRVRISYTVDLDDEIRRSINEYFGRPGLASRDQVKSWYQRHGLAMDDDLAQAADYRDRPQDPRAGEAW